MMLPSFLAAQTIWKSTSYSYSIEIPANFTKSKSVGANVDFKANDGNNSIVIVVKTIPNEYVNYSIWDILGDLTTFGSEWEIEASEYLNKPKFIKYGKTNLSGLETFWYDYTTENPKLYSKNYQTKKGNKLYTITLTCESSMFNSYSAVWLRFKEKMKIN